MPDEPPASPAALVAMLRDLLIAADGQLQRAAAFEFEQSVFTNGQDIGSLATDAILRDIAYDLTYFEPDPAIQLEDVSLYGAAEMRRRVTETLERLDAAGLTD